MPKGGVPRKPGPASTRARRRAACVDHVRRIVRALRVSAEGTRARAGISAAQLFVLVQLRDGAERSMNELAAATLTDRSSVSAVVEKLAARRLVRRAAAESDRRRAAVRITPAGLALLARAPEPPTALLVEALDALPAPQLAALDTTLARLVNAMGLSDEPAPMLFEEDGRPDRARAAPRNATRKASGRNGTRA